MLTTPCNNLAVERIARARDLGYPILFHCGFGPVDPMGRPYVATVEYGDDLVGIRHHGGADYLGSAVIGRLIAEDDAREAAEEDRP